VIGTSVVPATSQVRKCLVLWYYCAWVFALIYLNQQGMDLVVANGMRERSHPSNIKANIEAKEEPI